ncbi:unnamed protein product [Bursaphelenchus okinawaensis]|uniref:RING-type domain-containing protein n=1 Tax=Bursaphelenchus okinawaensis TaxID=465554 RepID=A0A811LPY8_9BILA|nr:unnamed protein product [Bursaphelenchus okinawaensis]CAG9126053.1 unnamed protein product [Bursaphelenchus okinawaensis]
MQKVEVRTVADTYNAFTLNSTGTTGYFYDREARNIAVVDLNTGGRTKLKWSGNYFTKTRWVCYHLSYCNVGEDTLIVILWYNLKKEKFCLSSHLIKDNIVGVERIRHYFPADIKHDSGYWIQHDSNVNVIFYARNEDPNMFWHFTYDTTESKVNELVRDSLPTHSRAWELPTLTQKGLLFVSHERNANFCLYNTDKKHWTKGPVAPDKVVGRGPASTGTWGQLHHSRGTVVCVQRVKHNDYISEVWLLDVAVAGWRLISSSKVLPSDSYNLALRILDDTHVYYHLESENLGPCMYQIQNAVPRYERKLSSIAEESDDIVCSVCLDTYEEPRLLDCGHSFCFKCLEGLLPQGIENGVKCPICRIITPNTVTNLRINYGLREAVQVLAKVRKCKENGLVCDICDSPTSENNMFVCLECNHKCCHVCVLFNHQQHRKIELRRLLRNQTEVKKIRDAFTVALLQVKEDTISKITQTLSTELCTPLIETCEADFEAWIQKKEDIESVKAESGERIQKIRCVMKEISHRITEELIRLDL